MKNSKQKEVFIKEAKKKLEVKKKTIEVKEKINK